MRLGTDTGSLDNWLMAGTKGQPAPEVGMGVTILGWTDRKAGTITRVSPSGKTFWFREDTATRVDGNGMSESQEYEYTADPSAQDRMARMTKSGAWKYRSQQVRVGKRDAYFDFSF